MAGAPTSPVGFKRHSSVELPQEDTPADQAGDDALDEHSYVHSSSETADEMSGVKDTTES